MTIALLEAKKALFLDTATGVDLSRIGGNNAVSRPRYTQSDDVFRTLIPLMGASEKQTRRVVEAIVEAFFGVGSGVNVYGVTPNILDIVIPLSLVYTGSLPTATYFQFPTTGIAAPLTIDANPGDSNLFVASNVGYVSGYLCIDRGQSREPTLLDPISPTTGATQLNLAPGNEVKWKHLAGTPILQLLVESSATSYPGDYFGVARREATLALGVSVGNTAATLNPGHTLPSQGMIWFEEDHSVRRETFFCSTSGTSLLLYPFTGHFPPPPSSFQFAHGAGTTVRYFDLEASATESSAIATNDNPIILWDDARIQDLKDALDVVTASGVHVECRIQG